MPRIRRHTSSTLAAGKAFSGRFGDGMGGNRGRAALAVATAALGLSLVAGGLLGHDRQAAPATAPDQRANPYWVYQEDAAIGGDVAAAALALIHSSPASARPAEASVAGDYRWAFPVATEVNTTSDLGTDYDPFVISSSQRRYVAAAASSITGETPCPLGGTAPCGLAGVARPSGISTSTEFRWDFPVAAVTFAPDQFTYREDRRVEASPTFAPSDYAPDFWTYREDRRGEASGVYRIWAGTCRAGSSDCLPDGDILFGEPAATSGTAAYRVSAPNEAEPDGSIVVAAPTQPPVDVSTSAQFRWAFGPESGMPAPDLAMLPPSLQNISA